MKGVRFYLEYPNQTAKKKATVKNPGKHSGTVVAVLHCNGYNGAGHMDAICGVFDTPNSPWASSTVSPEYLRERCKRIPEAMAKEIHPNVYNAVKD